MPETAFSPEELLTQAAIAQTDADVYRELGQVEFEQSEQRVVDMLRFAASLQEREEQAFSATWIPTEGCNCPHCQFSRLATDNTRLTAALSRVQALPEQWERNYGNPVVRVMSDELHAALGDTTPQPKSQGRCDTTMTERFENPSCTCPTYEGNLGPCAAYEMGSNGLCVYCDHNRDCHIERTTTVAAVPQTGETPKAGEKL